MAHVMSYLFVSILQSRNVNLPAQPRGGTTPKAGLFAANLMKSSERARASMRG